MAQITWEMFIFVFYVTFMFECRKFFKPVSSVIKDDAVNCGLSAVYSSINATHVKRVLLLLVKQRGCNWWVFAAPVGVLSKPICLQTHTHLGLFLYLRPLDYSRVIPLISRAIRPCNGFLSLYNVCMLRNAWKCFSVRVSLWLRHLFLLSNSEAIYFMHRRSNAQLFTELHVSFI